MRPLVNPGRVVGVGKGAREVPVHPKCLDEPGPEYTFKPRIERLMRAFDTGGEAQCSGHDYRQALEGLARYIIQRTT